MIRRPVLFKAAPFKQPIFSLKCLNRSFINKPLKKKENTIT